MGAPVKSVDLLEISAGIFIQGVFGKTSYVYGGNSVPVFCSGVVYDN